MDERDQDHDGREGGDNDHQRLRLRGGVSRAHARGRPQARRQARHVPGDHARGQGTGCHRPLQRRAVKDRQPRGHADAVRRRHRVDRCQAFPHAALGAEAEGAGDGLGHRGQGGGGRGGGGSAWGGEEAPGGKLDSG
ncbi:unnamed protein product, partial [Ectocarpus fasciculatus]